MGHANNTMRRPDARIVEGIRRCETIAGRTGRLTGACVLLVVGFVVFAFGLVVLAQRDRLDFGFGLDPKRLVVGAALLTIGGAFLGRACMGMVSPGGPPALLIRKLDAILAPRLSALASQRRALIETDRRGIANASKWNSELERVRDRVVLPQLVRGLSWYRFWRLKRLLFAWADLSSRMVCLPSSDPRGLYLSMYVAAHIDARACAVVDEIESMNSAEFEKHCAEVLRSDGWQIDVMGGSGDQGVNVVAERNDDVAVFQCTLRVSPVGCSTVQQAHDGKWLYSARRAFVVTNSGYTKDAIAVAREMEVTLLDPHVLEFISRR